MPAIAKCSVAIALSAACLFCVPAAAVEDLVVESRAAWEAWTFPPGTVELTVDGKVRAVRMRKNINAVADAARFSYNGPFGPAQGGIRSVGSGEATAARAIDGDPATAWAPSMADPPDTWWIEVDLGRAVAAQKLRLVFAEGGPPFSEFSIFTSTGEPRFPGTSLRAQAFTPVFRTLESNEARVFEFDFSVTDEMDRPLAGRLLQYVKVFFDRKVEGARLAEIEVVALGDNIAQGALERGGSATSGQVSSPVDAFDGLLWTGWKMTNLGSDWLQGKNLRNGPWLRLDLGAEYWVDTIKITSGGKTFASNWDPSPSMDGFKLYVSDGGESTVSRHEVWQIEGRNVVWDLVADVNNAANFPNQLDNFELRLEPAKKFRYVFFHHFYGASVWQTGYALGAKMFELHFYGDGFLPGVTLRSPLLQLGDAYVRAIEWEGEFPEGARVEVRSRTGDAAEETITYYDKNGLVVTRERYESIPSSFRGQIVTQRLPVEGQWSPWSPVYEHSGAEFASPSPSKFSQVEVKLSSERAEVAPVLERLRLRLADPVVRSIRGRIAPRSVEPGAPVRLVLELVPVVAPGDPGFDRIRVDTPGRVEQVEVAVGGNAVVPRSVLAGEDSLVLELATPIRRPVRVSFAALLERDNTVFPVAVARGAGTWQRVEADSTAALTVRMPAFAERGGLLHQVRLEPAVFTPNGDGINERLAVHFTVFKVDLPRRIRVQVYDLRGHLVRDLLDVLGTSGTYGPGAGDELSWDGGDEAGQRVPPGLYMVRIHVEGDEERQVVTRLVAVAY